MILKDKESLVALRPYQRGLVMHILNYLDEIKPVDEIPEMGGKKVKLDAQEISLGKLLVEKYRKKEFDIGETRTRMCKNLESLYMQRARERRLYHRLQKKWVLPKIYSKH